ncbi:hypothetical protein R1sor_009565 [Riccia sorocarpa]|uniref:Uncharacterized protein n=1 Tax=Riccia sorocarpa TaxID=122646 RepID=A0ABD3HYU1_9MARC
MRKCQIWTGSRHAGQMVGCPSNEHEEFVQIVLVTGNPFSALYAGAERKETRVMAHRSNHSTEPLRQKVMRPISRTWRALKFWSFGAVVKPCRTLEDVFKTAEAEDVPFFACFDIEMCEGWAVDMGQWATFEGLLVYKTWLKMILQPELDLGSETYRKLRRFSQSKQSSEEFCAVLLCSCCEYLTTGREYPESERLVKQRNGGKLLEAPVKVAPGLP